ncbi:MAG: alpha/beta fold hydrolase [Verrucomicrobiota bacterium]
MIKWPELRNRCAMLTPPLPWDRPRWRPREGETVVLLHGLWRGWRAMEPMERGLAGEQWSTLNIPYPSTRLPIEIIARFVRAEVEKVAAGKRVHFVTHSLGGIIARSLLANDPQWERGRLVMLAAPNQGSEIVDWANSRPALSLPLGPSGRQLGSRGIPSELPALPDGLEAAVIMGKRSLLPFFRKLLDAENDGIVSAPGGRIPGLREFAVIDADHTFIQMHPDVIRRTCEFLREGSFRPDGSQ